MLINMPAKIKSQITKNEDGSFSVFINAGLNYESRLEAYKHELRHIKQDDFDKVDVQEIESEAHS